MIQLMARAHGTLSSLLAAILLLSGCTARQPVRTTPSAAPIEQKAAITFTDVTREAGIHFHHVNGASGQFYYPETFGSGAAFIDYDRDGWPDILLVNSDYW